MNFIDLFAGAGGLSEGFIRAGFKPVAHVEIDSSACDTLRTRAAYHYLTSKGKSTDYYRYLKGEISRENLWECLPKAIKNSVINQEISEDSKSDIFNQIDACLADSEKVDLIIGGPPCQAYSLVGRSRDPNGMANDKRNYLFKDYAAYLKRYKPKYFVFENVEGLLSAGSKSYFNEMMKLFTSLGYQVSHKTLCSDDYGVLQKRKRVIIIGRKGKGEFKFPSIAKANISGYEIKKDLFADLAFLKPGDKLPVSSYTRPSTDYLDKFGIRNGIGFVTQHETRKHNSNDLAIYGIAIDMWVNKRKRLHYDQVPMELRTHRNISNFQDRYKVVDDKGVSHTIVAHLSKDGHHFIYPDLNQVRSLSVREAARIQSFPDDYFFEGGQTASFRQIGNAVPPLMAYAIAKELGKLIGNV